MNNTPDALFDHIPEASTGWPVSLVLIAIGIGVFLSLVVNLGPSFINLIQTSLHRGYRSASWFALGVISNDMLIISLCTLTGLTPDFSDPSRFRLLTLAAGLVILLFGLFTCLRKVPDEGRLQAAAEKTQQRTDEALSRCAVTPSWAIFLGKGFLLNVLNPFVWLFWFSAVTVVSANLGDRRGGTLLFFAIVMGSCLCIELLKARAAASFQRFFNPRRLRAMNLLLGSLLILFGLYFMLLK